MVYAERHMKTSFFLRPQKCRQTKNKHKVKKLNGFTIIEVVLVLAIAGLIFLMVFIGLPALQRSQRDRQRKNDAAIIAAAVRTYMSHNGGKPPTEQVFPVCDDYDVSKNGFEETKNQDFKKYVTDLCGSGVTEVVSVFKLKNGTYDRLSEEMLNTSNDRISNIVAVLYGGKCPEGEMQAGKNWKYVYTGRRSDVAISRWYESGKWSCMEV